ncbi:MAG: prolyl oligopeptidase family serine peptidase [Planctomycetes bacterium]|nr:prolyl oligopeptidase family serine peptidase [Planctomycetota bacterium]
MAARTSLVPPVVYPWRGTPPDAEGYPHYEPLRRMNDRYRAEYVRLLERRRRDRQARLVRSAGAESRWAGYANRTRAEFADCLGLGFGPDQRIEPGFRAAVPLGPFESAIPELASRLWARTYTVPAAAWEGGDIDLLIITGEGDNLTGAARPGVLILPDSGAALTGSQSAESAARAWGCAIAAAGFIVAIPRLPALVDFSSTRNKQRLLEGSCVLGAVIYEASRALGALFASGQVTGRSCWAVGTGLGALTAIMLAAIDRRVGGVIADAPTRWGTITDGQALIVPRSHAVTDLPELCAMIAPRPLALVRAATTPASAFEAPGADVQALARSARAAFSLTRAAGNLTLFSAGARGSAIAWMAKRELVSAGRPAPALVRSSRPERRYAVTRCGSAREWLSTAKRLRREYRARTGMPRVNKPLSVRLVSTRQLPQYQREEFHIRTGEHTLCSVAFLRPAGAPRRRTTIVCLPGSGSDIANVEKHYGHEVIAEGWNACIIDARVAIYPFHPGAAEERALITQSMHDILACVDWMVDRPDVDRGRIGAMGVSQGGSHSWMLAALDARIAAVAPICGVASYRSVIEGYRTEWYDKAYISMMDGSHIYYFTPGVLELAEQQDLISLIAPRPLAIISANHDSWFPLDGMRAVAADARHAYRLLDASPSFEYHEFEGPHDMPEHSRRRAYAFLRKHLESRNPKDR